MEKPTLEVRGKKYEMPEPKARMWREWVEFDVSKKEIPAERFIEAHCEIMSRLYGGEPRTEELLDELELSEVLKKYHDAVNYLTSLLYAKFEKLSKNSSDDVVDA